MKKFFDWLFPLSFENRQNTKRTINPMFSGHTKQSTSQDNLFENRQSSTFIRPLATSPLNAEDDLSKKFAHTVKDSLDNGTFHDNETKIKERLDEALCIASSKTALIQDHQKASAISSLIGEKESLVLIRLMRWKNGIQCPYCHSFHIKILDSKNHKYQCLDCQSSGHNSVFDVLTNYFPKNGDWHSARTWILIQYLKIFLPLSRVAKILGISLEETMRILAMVQPNEKSLKKDLVGSVGQKNK